MKRVKKRRYGRDKTVVATAPSTHVIKLGWKTLSRNGKEIPNKLNGFLICRDSIDSRNQNRLMIDYHAMEMLGRSMEQVDNAIKAGFTADDSLLPQTLRFIIMNRAKPVEGGGFDYPGTHSEAYECYTKKGLFCSGDGVNADRKMDDGTRKHIPCVPYGRDDVSPDQFCQYSGPGGECKLHYRLTVCLYCVDDNGQRRPISADLGEQSRYRLDSTSEYVSMQILDALDRAAERVGGLIHGLTGTLQFQKRSRRTGEGAAVVGSVLFSIDESSIRQREREIREAEESRRRQMIENKQVGIEYLPSSQLLIEGPAIIDVEPTRHADPEPVSVVESEPVHEQEPEPVSEAMEEADDEPASDIDILIRALDEWAELTALENDEKRSEPIRRLMIQVDERTQAVAQSVDGVAWFDDKRINEQKRTGRHELLRSMCEVLMNSNDKNFKLGDEVEE